jgi:predicted GIY-YIG superfamily endonuclease
MNEPRSILYVAKDKSFCKIGVTNNPERRCHEFFFPSSPHLSVSARSKAVKLLIVKTWSLGPAAIVIERYIKAKFKHKNIPCGYEWFRIGLDEIVQAVEDAMSGVPIPTLYHWFGKTRVPKEPGKK